MKDLFFIFAMFVCADVLLLNWERYDLKELLHPNSVEKVASIDKARTLDQASIPRGTYIYQGEYFDIELFLNKERIVMMYDGFLFSLKGTAKYEVVGSTLQYSDMQGDDIFFPKEGHLITVFDNSIEFNGGERRLTFQSKFKETEVQNNQ